MEIRLIRFDHEDQTISYMHNTGPLSTPEYIEKGDIFDALNAAEKLGVPWEIEQDLTQLGQCEIITQGESAVSQDTSTGESLIAYESKQPLDLREHLNGPVQSNHCEL